MSEMIITMFSEEDPCWTAKLLELAGEETAGLEGLVSEGFLELSGGVYSLTEDGRTFVEIRTDIYRRHKSLKTYTAKLIEARGISDKVDWQKIDRLIKEETGIAEDVSLGRPAKAPSAPGSTSAGPGFTDRIVDYFKAKFRKTGQAASTQKF